MASMALHATRMTLHAGRSHVAVRRMWLTPLRAFHVNNMFINIRPSLRCATTLPLDTVSSNSPPRRSKLTHASSPHGVGNEGRSLSSVAFKKVSMAQQVAEYLEIENIVGSYSSYDSANVSSGELSHIESLVTRYLITIATEPLINTKNIVDIFDLYARTGRPLVQDMNAFPDEFRRLAPISEQGLSSMTVGELKNLASSLSFLRTQDLKIVNRLIKALCHECSSRLKNIPIREGIQYFEIVHHFHGTRQPFYGIFAEYFSEHIDDASDKELVKLMHFCTRKQKTSDADFVQRALNRLEKTLDSVSLVTLGIVADSVARSGLELNSELPLLQQLVPVLKARINEDKKWTDLEVCSVHSIVNLFRLARFNDEGVTSAIEQFLLTCEDSCLDVQTIPEFLAFLATRSYHRDVFARIEDLLLLILKSSVSISPKLQDYARILWAFSATNHKCSDEFVSLVFANFHSFFAIEYTNNNFLKSVDALLSLAMMGHIDRQLTPRAFEPLKGRAKGYKGSEHMLAKLVNRQTVLRQCLTIEAPDISLPHLETPSKPSDFSQELQRRPALSTLFDQLKQLNECSKDGAVVFLARPISSVFVASVCIDTTAAASALSSTDSEYLNTIDGQLLDACCKSGVNVSIEVLDDTCTIKSVQQSSRSTGLVNFKIRLLKKLGWKILIVSGDDVCSTLDFKTLLLEYLQKVE